LVALGVLLGLAGACSFILVKTPQYVATAQLFVASSQDNGSTGAYQGGLFTQQRVQSYSDIVGSPQVTGPVVRELRLSESPAELSDAISASAPANTVLLNISVRNPNPQKAQRIAQAVAEQFIVLVNKIERPTTGGPAPVRLSIVKPAALPSSPVSPRVKRDLGLGLVLGLLVGLGAAALRESLDTSVKSAEQLVDDLGLPVLGVVGFDPDASRHPLIAETNPRSVRAEAFRQVRTNLTFVNVDAQPRSVVVTSSLPAEGKTTVSCNLAIALAQTGVRVAVVEGDLRRPRLAHYLGIERAVGLTSVLVGAAELDDALQPWGKHGLMALPSGPLPPNPSELLSSLAMRDLLSRLQEMTDIVVIDGPPLLPVTDAAILSSLVSGTIMVVRASSTKTEQVRLALTALQSVDARVFGAVFNMAPTRGPDAHLYGYPYGYGEVRDPRRAHARERRDSVVIQPDPVPAEVAFSGSAQAIPARSKSKARLR
jgi:capsular exopolysaccharide synthesis family protein